MQHLELLHPIQHQKREAAQPQLNPLEQPVPRSQPLENVPEFIDNERVRISGVKACETVSTIQHPTQCFWQLDVQVMLMRPLHVDVHINRTI